MRALTGNKEYNNDGLNSCAPENHLQWGNAQGASLPCTSMATKTVVYVDITFINEFGMLRLAKNYLHVRTNKY